jgi:hypothetical protein
MESEQEARSRRAGKTGRSDMEDSGIGCSSRRRNDVERADANLFEIEVYPSRR